VRVDDPAGDDETQPGALTDRRGGEVRIEYPLTQVAGDSRTGVGDVDEQAGALGAGGQRQSSTARHRVDGVGDQVGPHLVQLAAPGGHRRKPRVEAADHLHPRAEALAENRQRGLQPLVHVEVLLGALVEVGVLPHRRHQRGDAPAALPHLGEDLGTGERDDQPPHHVVQRGRRHGVGQLVQALRVDAGRDQDRRLLPRPIDIVRVEPVGHNILGVGALQRGRPGGRPCRGRSGRRVHRRGGAQPLDG
jgi:hypothetical protein